MAEIEFLLPTVQYGNVKVRATPEELGIDGVQDAGAIGVAVAVYLNLFTQGFKVGGAMDVEYDDGGTKPPKLDPIPRADEPAVSAIKEQLGATVVEEIEEQQTEAANAAPWDTTVDSKPKPWETGAQPVKVAEIDWS